ncbi:hypothetical protein OH799_06110 [Nocardia sp. NBC_00881]|uniref:hypothetical protein n=1 Tax=Nocardia sp. NBC_00881 TaxID=2975995 RepID=UPI00386D53E3|nr:hypothetical protein OH799_06110 [Nocardia sp. NBC_00881]
MAIIGAGPGLGAATAARFGRKEHSNEPPLNSARSKCSNTVPCSQGVPALGPRYHRRNLATATEFSILGPVTEFNHVLPGMRALGRGTILFVNGSSAAAPNPAVAGASIAFAGESAYAAMLHDALAPENIHIGQLIIPGAIGGGVPQYAPLIIVLRYRSSI